MPTFEMVCLANSRKRKGRCVAGLRTDGQGWIRPIGSNAEGVLHPYHYTLHNNTEAQPLDVLRVDCSRAQPTPHHPEDWIAQPVSWRLVSRPISGEQVEWLRSHLATGPRLLGCTHDKIPHSLLQTRPAAQSLALVAPRNLQWLVKIGEAGERKIRATFTLDGAEYSLALTDPLWEGRLQHLPPGAHPRSEARSNMKAGDDVWLTVSLSEPFAPDGGGEEHCYKLAAGVIVVPHTGKMNAVVAVGSPTMKPQSVKADESSASETRRGAIVENVKQTFPANPGVEKSLSGKRRSLPDLSAYPDPFADDENDDNEENETLEQAAPARKEATGKEAIGKEAIGKEAIGRDALNAAALIKQAEAVALPETQATDALVSPTPTADITPAEIVHPIDTEDKAGNSLEADAPAKPPTRFDKLRQQVPRAFMRWTSEEDAILLEQMQAGGSIESIAAQMQRHEGAVRKRLEKFGLIEAEEVAPPAVPTPKPQAVQSQPLPQVPQAVQAQSKPQTPQAVEEKQEAPTPSTPSPSESGASAGASVGSSGAGVGNYSMSESKVKTLSKEQKASPAPSRRTDAIDTIRVVVCGAAGRMGREVVKAVVEADGLHLVAAVDVSLVGSDAGELAGIGKIGVVIESQLEPTLERWMPDVLVDFTLPDSVKRNAVLSLDHGVSPVIGTTGLSASDLSTLDALAKDKGIGAFIAPNFAIGAVLAMQFAAQAARYLPDVEIIELHHEKKLDSPSGTALLTAQKIAWARHEAGVSPLPAPANTLEKAPGARGARHANTGDIPVHSVRLPGFVAHQEVIFGGQGEILTIRHDSIHRSSFMPGVVLAVRKVRALNGLVIGLEHLLL